ncbi:MAG TPA: GpE family phage tail protein [Methylomirabilota bacterium]|nr:GpE family phage tail protein [Methylomirabilota bacterium]
MGRGGHRRDHGLGVRFFSQIPAGWQAVVGDVGYHFHFPPSEIWEMDLEELGFWHRQLRRINEELERNG